jgi:hypothetical protein
VVKIGRRAECHRKGYGEQLADSQELSSRHEWVVTVSRPPSTAWGPPWACQGGRMPTPLRPGWRVAQPAHVRVRGRSCPDSCSSASAWGRCSPHP